MKRAHQFWQANRNKHTTRSQRRLVLSAVLLCLTPLAALAQKPTTSVPVTVTNTTTNPVPTAATGTTTVSGTVGISGTPTVTLGAGTTVNSTDMSAVNIVRLVGIATEANGGALTLAFGVTYQVPSGKRLVINSGSSHIRGTGTGFQPLAYLFVGSTTYTLSLPLQQQSDGSYIATLPGPIYVDENKQVALGITANQSWDAPFFFQGYLVDCGTGCTQQ